MPTGSQIPTMDDLSRRALTGSLKFYVALAALIFIPAWSLRYWQGWLYWLVLLTCTLATTLYFLKHDPALVERRMAAGPKAEREPMQKLIQTVAAIFGCATILVSVLDHRMDWSTMAPSLAVAADGLVIVGFVIVFLTLRTNSFAAATIVISPDQRVISSGPYAWVRHPMYSGTILFFAGMPLLLGSWWGLIMAPLFVVLFGFRARLEERALVAGLPGYADYLTRVRYRLIPGIWSCE